MAVWLGGSILVNGADGDEPCNVHVDGQAHDWLPLKAEADFEIKRFHGIPGSHNFGTWDKASMGSSARSVVTFGLRTPAQGSDHT